jgi:hypothetical protein
MRHLPVILGFPHPVIAHNKTAMAIIRKPDLAWRKRRRLKDWVLFAAIVIRTTRRV